MADIRKSVNEVRHGECVTYEYKLVTTRKIHFCRQCRNSIPKGIPAWTYGERYIHRACLSAYERKYRKARQIATNG